MAPSSASRDSFPPGNDAPAHPHRYHPLSLLQKRQDAKDRRHSLLHGQTPLSVHSTSQHPSSRHRQLTILPEPSVAPGESKWITTSRSLKSVTNRYSDLLQGSP